MPDVVQVQKKKSLRIGGEKKVQLKHLQHLGEKQSEQKVGIEQFSRIENLNSFLITAEWY